MNVWAIVGLVVGWLITIVTTVFIVGRWTRTVEVSDATELLKLSMKLEQLIEQVKDLKSSISTQYTAIVQQQSADHQRLRAIEDWRNGLLAELMKHFHPVTMIERFRIEDAVRLAALDSRVETMEERIARLWDGHTERRAT